MNAEAIILQEFRENAAAICAGRDPLDDPEYFKRYVRSFPEPKCTTKGCNAPIKARGLCNTCYTREKRAGTLDDHPTIQDRIHARAEVR